MESANTWCRSATPCRRGQRGDLRRARVPEGAPAAALLPDGRCRFIYPAHERSARYTIIEIETFEGRSKEVLKRLVSELYARVPAATGIDPRDLDVIISEQPATPGD